MFPYLRQLRRKEESGSMHTSTTDAMISVSSKTDILKVLEWETESHCEEELCNKVEFFG